MLKCYYHKESDATHTDSVIDLDNSTTSDIVYKRIPICCLCVMLRKSVNTSRIEPINMTPKGHE